MSDTTRLEEHRDRETQGSQLCLSCGLCCQGVLFNHVPLENDETELATKLGLRPYSENSDSLTFSLPCSLYKDEKCSVYSHRPKACVDYQCDLLKKFLQGMISFEQSMVLVQSAKELMSAVRQHIGPGDPSHSIWQQIADLLERQGKEQGDAHLEQANARLLLDEKQLALMCRHFKMDESVIAATSPVVASTELSDPKVQLKGKGFLKLSAHTLVGDQEGQIVVSNTQTGEYVGLIGVAADMWRALVEYDDLEDVVKVLLRDYDIDETTLQNDLHAFVESLLARSLLELSDAPLPGP